MEVTMHPRKIIPVIVVALVALIVCVVAVHVGGSAIDMVRAHLSGAGR
jgi:hypothetical protein